MLRDQIEAARQVDGDGKLTADSRRAIAALKTDALQTLIARKAERSFTLPGARSVTISDVSRPHDGPGDPLSFRMEVRDGEGRLIDADDHFVINPPVMVATEGGEPVENLRGAFRAIVASIVTSKLGRD